MLAVCAYCDDRVGFSGTEQHGCGCDSIGSGRAGSADGKTWTVVSFGNGNLRSGDVSDKFRDETRADFFVRDPRPSCSVPEKPTRSS